VNNELEENMEGNVKYYSGICLEGQRKLRRSFEVIHSLCRYLNLEALQHSVLVLTTDFNVQWDELSNQ
jgi:hypothetical protein